MIVKLTMSRAGARISQNAGDQIEVAAAEGARMIAAGQAVAVKETATRKHSPSKAVKD